MADQDLRGGDGRASRLDLLLAQQIVRARDDGVLLMPMQRSADVVLEALVIGGPITLRATLGRRPPNTRTATKARTRSSPVLRLKGTLPF